MSAQIIPSPIGDHDQLPFSSFQDAPDLRDAELTVRDLHDGATAGSSPYLRHWMLGRPVERHTTLIEIREWISRRCYQETGKAWVRMIMEASDEDELIARICA